MYTNLSLKTLPNCVSSFFNTFWTGAENYSRFVGDLPRIRKLEKEAKDKKEREEEHAALIQDALKKQNGSGGGSGGSDNKGVDDDVISDTFPSGKKIGAMTMKKMKKKREEKKNEKRLERREIMLERKKKLAATVAKARSGVVDKELKEKGMKDTKIDPDTIFRLLKLSMKLKVDQGIEKLWFFKKKFLYLFLL